MHSFRAGVGGLHLGHRIAGALGEEANGAGVRLAHSQFIPYGGVLQKKSFSARMQRSFPTLSPFIYLPRWALRGEEGEGLESPGGVLHVLRVCGGFKR